MKIKGGFSKDELVMLSSAASLGYERENISGKDVVDVSRLLKLAELNGVEISLVRFLTDQLQLSNPLLTENILALERLKSEREKLALNVQRIAQKNRCQVLFIKSFMDFPYVDNDVDLVLIADSQILDFESSITRHGFICHKSRSQWREPNKRHYYLGGVTQVKEKPVCLHLHFFISWNSMIFLDRDKVWERRREYHIRENTITIPSIEDEILIIAAHTVFENKHVKLWEIIQFFHLLGSGEIDWDYIIQSSKRYNWSAGLWLFLQSMRVITESVKVPCPIPRKTFATLMKEDRFLHRVEKLLIYKKQLPFLLPFLPTLIIFFHKFVLDLTIKDFRSLLRELVALTIFDWVLYYRLRKKLWKLGRRERNL